MAKRVSVDRWLFTVTMLLAFVGLVMVFSASAGMARGRFGCPYAFCVERCIWAATGRAGGLERVWGGHVSGIFGIRIWGVGDAVVFPDLSCELAARPHSGVLESLCGSTEDRVPHYPVADRGGHGRYYRNGPHGGEAEIVLS